MFSLDHLLCLWNKINVLGFSLLMCGFGDFDGTSYTKYSAMLYDVTGAEVLSHFNLVFQNILES